MKTEFFIARRMLFAKGGNASGGGTKPIVRIAIAGIALGLLVMIAAIAIVTGFQEEIREKVIGFGSHIQISNFDSNNSFEPVPVSIHQPFYPSLDTVEGVRSISVFAYKAGIIKTDDQIEGVLVKGVGSDFDWSFFDKYIMEGATFSTTDSSKSKNILISEPISRKLNLKTGDNLRIYFIQDKQRLVRPFIVSGVYKTGLEEFDKNYVITDIAHIRKLNNWEDDQVAGFEVLINDYSNLDDVTASVNQIISYELIAQNIRDLQPQVFDWLQLQDINVQIIIILMLLVAGINMISALLIMILERTAMIGLLKSFGMNNGSIRKVFLISASYLTLSGMFWGNIIGISLCLLQHNFHFITLPQESYYVPYVPISLKVSHLILLNAGTFIVCFVMLILPSYIISKISPLRAIRYS